MALRRNILANYIGAGWTALMNVAFVSAYIRYLGAEGYGLVGVFALLIGLLTLVDLGMAPTVSREFARMRASPDGGASDMAQLLRGVECVVGVLATVIAAVIWCGSGWLAEHWLGTRGIPVDDVASALRVMGVLVALRLVENVYRSALIGLQRQVALNVVLACSATWRNAGAFVVVAWFSPTAAAFFYWQLLAGVATVIAFAAVVYTIRPAVDAPRHFSFGPLQAAWRFAAGTMMVASMSVVLGNMDKVLLTRLLSLEAFGYYALAVVVAQTPLGLVAPIAQAFYPRFTQLFAQGSVELSDTYHLACQLVSVLLGTATVFLVLLGHPLLLLWLHDPTTVDHVQSLVSILAVGSMLNGMMTLPYYLQLSAGWTGLTIRLNLLAITMVVPALLLFVPMYGPMAAACTWLGLNAGYTLVVVPLMHRRLLQGEQGMWYLHDVLRPLLAATFLGSLWRLAAPDTISGIGGWFWLAMAGTTMLVAAAMAAPRLRRLIRSQPV
ncbi:oligosaccharide flippase family protein [Luteibacter sp. 9133]|uniref:lipopolysaccharide biosynthesis protein n=1 Tax=Luteibacter sp. 9133 TaxID=1500891 RepID=UPI0005BAE2F8|nr:oligosaccharide flippase family protein [Luteibacter sp. 9133]